MVAACLWRTGWRHLVRHRWLSVLSVTGIALGVAIVTAVDLARVSAAHAFTLSMQQLSGRATHQILAGAKGIPEHQYTELRIRQGLRRSAPVVEGLVRLQGEGFTLLGLDPLAERPFRQLLPGTGNSEIRSLISRPYTLYLAATSAHRLGISVGDRIRLEVAGRETTLDVIALMGDRDDAVLDGLLVTDIATAQEVLGRIGRLDRIDLILDEAEVEFVSQRLPTGTRLVTTEFRSENRAQMSEAFLTNLQAMSLLALLVGGYLIYNAMAFSVLQRRPLLGILRVMGVTRTEMFRQFLLEAFLFGSVGTLLGMLLGVLLAQGLLQLVTQTINDLYFSLRVSRLTLMPVTLTKVVLLGIGTALAATLIPAFEAAGSRPATILRRSSIETRTHRALPWLQATGIVALLTGMALIWGPGRSLEQGFAALFFIILGYTLLLPGLVLKLSDLALPLLKRRFGSVGLLAVRGIGAALSRTGMAIAALSLAVASTVGMGIMIDSFRGTVAEWLQQTLQGDFYVSIPERDSESAATPLSPGIAEQIRHIPGVREVSMGRSVRVEAQTGPVNLLALEAASVSYRGFRFKDATLEDLWDRFHAGELILVSEPYAYHQRLGVGDQVELLTATGWKGFILGGVFFDYGSDRGMLVMARDAYQRSWRDPTVSTLGVYLDAGAEADRVSTGLRRLLGAIDPRIRVRANGEILAQSLQIFDRTFTITRVLRVLVILIAFVGILSAFMALQLERGREYAVLRATGLLPAQQWKLISLQTGIMGLLAGLFALPLGWVMAEVLIRVINLRAFGWSLQRLLPVDVLIEGVLLALIAALLAGVYPAIRMMRTTPAMALREE